MEEKELKKPRNFKEQVEVMLGKIIMRAEKEVPDFGDFAPVTEFFPNLDSKSSDIVGMYGLTILKFPKDVVPDPRQRYVEASAYEPTGSYKAKMIVASGYKAKILTELRDVKFLLELCYTYGDLADSLRD